MNRGTEAEPDTDIEAAADTEAEAGIAAPDTAAARKTAEVEAGTAAPDTAAVRNTAAEAEVGRAAVLDIGAAPHIEAVRDQMCCLR